MGICSSTNNLRRSPLTRGSQTRSRTPRAQADDDQAGDYTRRSRSHRRHDSLPELPTLNFSASDLPPIGQRQTFVEDYHDDLEDEDPQQDTVIEWTWSELPSELQANRCRGQGQRRQGRSISRSGTPRGDRCGNVDVDRYLSSHRAQHTQGDSSPQLAAGHLTIPAYKPSRSRSASVPTRSFPAAEAEVLHRRVEVYAERQREHASWREDRYEKTDQHQTKSTLQGLLGSQSHRYGQHLAVPVERERINDAFVRKLAMTGRSLSPSPLPFGHPSRSPSPIDHTYTYIPSRSMTPQSPTASPELLG